MPQRRLLAVSRVVWKTSRWESTMPSLSSSHTAGIQELDMAADLDRQINVPFSRAKLGPFLQPMPDLGNQFTEDSTLKAFLQRYLPKNVYDEICPDLERFGHRVATDILNLHRECEQNPPTIQHYDAWGRRVDNIKTSEAWRKMKTISAEEGLIAIAYEGRYAEHSRLYQIAKNYLYSASSGLYSCPLAMTDGAAKSLQVLGDARLLDRAYSRLTSRDPDRFWTSGQWMTERRGGSDVAGGTETVAIPQPDGSYKLHGYKWFSSATDSDMSLTLARVLDSHGKTTPGTGGLSMFYLETRDQQGRLNNLEVHRLKDKLGTRQLPTAELLLDGTTAYRVSGEGRGVASITTMLTLTRLHNATSAAGTLRRVTSLARDYATKRSCFGKIIKDYPLHVKILAHMEVEARAALVFTLEMARILGLEDCGKISEHQKHVFRLLTPVLKLYTAKQAVSMASEGLESFGGAGYLEDTGLPLLLRDAQVLPIWEGTTNILSLDVLRALAKSRGECLRAYHRDITDRLTAATVPPPLTSVAAKLATAAGDIVTFASQHPDQLEMAGRDFAYSLARTYMGMLLVEHASWTGASQHDIYAAQRWSQQDLTPVVTQGNHGNYSKSTVSEEYGLAFDGYQATPGSKL